MDHRSSIVGIVACGLAIAWPALSSGDVVVSQVYGGGGNAGAALKLDFVELVNRGGSPVDLTGWSVQYASATASTWQVTELAGSLPSGSYYLIQLGGGGGGSVDLPPADAIGITNMSATSGKVALVDVSSALQGACPVAAVVDLVGYGTANCFEGSSAAPAGSNTQAVVRAEGGCADSDDNAADFVAASAAPRNSADSVDCGNQPLSTETPTSSPADTATEHPADTPTQTPSDTPTVAPSPTATDSPAHTPTDTPTESPTETPTESPSETPAHSPTESPTDTPNAPLSATPTSSAVPSTATFTATAPPTESPTPPAETETITPTGSPTPPPTAYPSATASPQPSPTGGGAVCGNGVAEPGEQCDDGNEIEGDLCPNGCSYRDSGALAHGHHRRRLVRGDGCQLEWYVVDSDLTHDPFGFTDRTQTCVDQDPGCDFDSVVGRCRFFVVACVNNVDPVLPECEPSGVSDAAIVHPPAPRGPTTLRDVNRAALEHALNHLIDPANPAAGPVNHPPLGPTQRDFCSAPFALEVERRGKGSAAVNLIVDTFGNGERPRRERARLRLVCTP